MSFNQDQTITIESIAGHLIKVVENFKYLGGRMKSSEDDISQKSPCMGRLQQAAKSVVIIEKKHKSTFIHSHC